MRDISVMPKNDRLPHLLAATEAKCTANLYAVTHAQDLTMVPLQCGSATNAVIRTQDDERLTARQAGGPQHTRSRWFLKDGEVRALSTSEGPNMRKFSYSVATLVMGAKDGETMQMQDPRILTPGNILVY